MGRSQGYIYGQVHKHIYNQVPEINLWLGLMDMFMARSRKYAYQPES
jgi:hypothetical protein